MFKKRNTFYLHTSWDSNPEHLGCEPSVLTIIPAVARYLLLLLTPTLNLEGREGIVKAS